MVIGEDSYDSSRIAQGVHAERVTVMQTVPAMLKQLLRQDVFRASSHLRHVICGGDVLESDTVRAFYEAFSGARLHNLYGPTEASIDATWWSCSPQDVGARIPIGRPIANTIVVLLDEDDHEVPVGEPGEIHIAGPGVATGYLGKPELTAERFVECPSLKSSGTTYYRTGDRGVYRSDGALEFLGRMDRQVKIRGFRVEPAEVESALTSHPSVGDAVVVARLRAKDTLVLVAYVVPATGDTPIVQQQLRDHVASSLPPTWCLRSSCR